MRRPFINDPSILILPALIIGILFGLPYFFLTFCVELGIWWLL